MLTNRPRFFLLISFALFSNLSWGQAARSPFSSFGLGDHYSTALTNAQGMGGVGVSNPTYWFINNQNPALLVFNRLTTFEAGLIGEQRNQLSSTINEKSGSGNLNYLVLGVPVKPGKWGSALGLMPYTRLNYTLKYAAPISGSTATVNVTEEGTGGINQVYFSNGIAINKRVSVGLKAAYLFSAATIDFTNTLDQPSLIYTVYPAVKTRTFVSDFQFSPAISLHYDSLFRKDYRLNFGAVYDLKTNVNSEFNLIADRLSPAGTIFNSDTLINNQPGTITLPSVITAGVSFGRSYVWTVAVDGSYGYYSSQYKDLIDENPYGNDYWRIAAGFELTPDPVSLSNYLKRVTYRTGVSYENYPYLVNGSPVKDFGITFGLSVPVSRVSSLDIALKVGKKGDKATNTIEENYLKLYFGITFNDQWFVKRRFD